MLKKLLISLLLLSTAAFAADPTFGTAAKSADGTAAATTVATGATFSCAIGALCYCMAVYDDNGTSTHVTGMVVSGSPTYTVAWAKRSTDGSIFFANIGGGEVWTAIPSSTITSQTVTSTISSSEKQSLLCNSASGQDPSTPIPASNSGTQTVGTTATLTVTSSGHDNSKYVGFFMCFDNTAMNGFSSGAAYTDDGCVNCSNVASQYTHLAVAHSTTNVTPAGNTIVNFTQVHSCASPAEIAFEIALPSAGTSSRTVRVVSE